MVSEKRQYGGTPDLIAIINNGIDFRWSRPAQ